MGFQDFGPQIGDGNKYLGRGGKEQTFCDEKWCCLPAAFRMKKADRSGVAWKKYTTNDLT